ncbi:MAG: 50S ribosomal protein L10 [Synergistaceae bacterium]|nr:50S ribosomal protein L10 [Synergistaceae bacterium]
MPAIVKLEQVKALRELLNRTKAVFIAEYRGMTVAQSTLLRSRVRAAGGEMKVAKNTLLEIAMKEENMTALPETLIAGPNVYTMAYDDPAAVAKTLRDFSKEKTNKAFIIKGGVLGKSVLDLAAVEALADMPSREVLIGQVVRTIAAPISGFLNVLNGPMRGLLNVLNAIKDKKDAA